ncbi:hypothetical protein OW763_13350 [Clostridium aestuarii]|uniref:NfeD-like C-terminal domain-containing protein n=1 Tax=Clostridium aestuarii TaxID=338193 RepID=A0ABT4D546_9CLOT|nr:hypothetical protein [Clostridium aestuarii]MCY6485320.1 hypothetical protein [Clostridium aestuarii]
MSIWWSNIPNFEKFFWSLAIPFTALFIIQMVMIIMGIDNDIDVPNMNDNIDIPDMNDGIDVNFENVPLKLVSFRNLVIFFTIFSWAGITGSRHGYSKALTILLAIALGIAVIVILSSVYKLIFKLTESGNMDLKNAVGSVGQVYLTIPANRGGSGKIQVIFQSALREMPAITYGQKLKTGTKVVVVGVEKELLVVDVVDDNEKGDIKNA